MRLLLALGIFATLDCSIALEERASGPSAIITNGTVIGSSSAGVDSFKGIPFAQAPIGKLRLKPPQPIPSGFATLSATKAAPACPQYTAIKAPDPLLPAEVSSALVNATSAFASALTTLTMPQSEDCLFVDIIRPSGTTYSSKLPVLFWIYGGGWQSGSTASLDGTSIVQRSTALGEPVIYVAANYRLAGLGWLGGRQLAADGSTNLGARDQRLALQWVAENIAAFGGDPDKVTMWGESAGSVSVFNHLIINKGDNTYKGKPLFRGAIMSSGTSVPAQEVTADKVQAIYDLVAEKAGCSGNDSLNCLRSVDTETFVNAQNAAPDLNGYTSLDAPYLPRPDPSDNFFPVSPEVAYQRGDFAKVPVIVGNQEDEGTTFSLASSNITTNQEVIDYFTDFFAPTPDAADSVANYVATYPDQPLLGQPAGSPFRTGSLNNFYPQYKRIAAIHGDMFFTLARRNVLEIIASQVPSWSFLATNLFGTPFVGTLHVSDLISSYGLLGPLPIQTVTYQSHFIHFTNYLDPNKGNRIAGLIEWPKWTSSTRKLLNIGTLGNSLLADTFRQDSSDYLRANASIFRR